MTTAQPLSIVSSPRAFPRPDAAPAEVFRRPREDALPEHLHYRDGGCDLFAACLTCPLPHCRYDVPGGAARCSTASGTRTSGACDTRTA